MVTTISDDAAIKFMELLYNIEPSFNHIGIFRAKELIFYLFAGDREDCKTGLTEKQWETMDYLFDTLEEDKTIVDVNSLFKHYDNLSDALMKKLKAKGLV